MYIPRAISLWVFMGDQGITNLAMTRSMTLNVSLRKELLIAWTQLSSVGIEKKNTQ